MIEHQKSGSGTFLKQNVSLKSFNSFGISATAKHFGTFCSVEDLVICLDENRNINFEQSPLILGGGSNILLTKDVEYTVLKNNISGIKISSEDEHHVYVQAGAGESWHSFVQFCITHNLAGVENLSLIPGSVGASPMQNIGAYGVEIKDVFYSLEAYHLKDKKLVRFSNNECAFGYRESIFKNKYKNQFVIITVTFRLNKLPKLNISYGAIASELERMGVQSPGIKDVSMAVINIRRGKLPDPAVIGNAGSFFKNPEVDKQQFEQIKNKFPDLSAYPLDSGKFKLAAGWLIEQCGWKGYRDGDAGCYCKQALVLVNFGQATGQKILELSTVIISSVKEKFGVILQREVNII